MESRTTLWPLTAGWWSFRWSAAGRRARDAGRFGALEQPDSHPARHAPFSQRRGGRRPALVGALEWNPDDRSPQNPRAPKPATKTLGDRAGSMSAAGFNTSARTSAGAAPRGLGLGEKRGDTRIWNSKPGVSIRRLNGEAFPEPVGGAAGLTPPGLRGWLGAPPGRVAGERFPGRPDWINSQKGGFLPRINARDKEV